MKNMLIILSLIALMQACSNSPKPANAATTTATAAPTTTPTTPQATASAAETDAKNVDFAKKTSAAI